MQRIVKALVVCSLLIAAAVSPAVAASQPHEGAVTAHGVHVTGTPEGHTP